MRPLFSRPYRWNASVRYHFRTALLFGVFVFVFLLIFMPFGLHTVGGELAFMALGYAAVCTGIMWLLNLGVPRLAPSLFSESSWNMGRQLLWTTANVGLVALGNALYTVGMGLAPLSVATVLNFTFFTMAVGLFPIALSIVLNENRLNREYSRSSARMNKELEAQVDDQPLPPPSGATLIIPAETKSDDLELDGEALVFIRSADNYIEVYHLVRGQVERTVLRGSLKAVEQRLASDLRFLRCHKSHLVDLRKVEHVSGNAQGLKLHLRGVSEPVPVSRLLTTVVRDRISIRP